MARKPEVFVRALTMEEGRRLQRITRSAKDPVKLRRVIVVLMSAQGQSASAIKALMQVSDDYVRQVVHVFNERGFDALDPKWSGGRMMSRTTPAAVSTLDPSACSLCPSPGTRNSSRSSNILRKR
ncbi:helix-turn-helix domain-containing protein [Streptosporangium subroseum]|uniref:helix-turn-helix domain-containing protein n=1 Tax=Streptosporangium subroseum TaxID=106412 RepID=UPI001FE39C0A|nr:helix-turn-helix domain-containing protein [Streptosporangium subroseum]